MSKAAKALRILIADDHELVRQGIRGILKAHRGWKIVGEAVDGEAAIQKARTLRPDIVILDITMPMDGLEATRQIVHTMPDTKVLVLSMHESDQMVRRALESGAQGYVLKSDLAAHLVKAVVELSHGRSFLTPKVSEIVLRGFLKVEKEPARFQRADIRPSPREIEIIHLLAEGRGNKEVASLLGITVRTVETHRANILHKLGLSSLRELIQYAIRNEIATKPES
jgi:DNA-binding NarL/FixJ family response regulator